MMKVNILTVNYSVQLAILHRENRKKVNTPHKCKVYKKSHIIQGLLTEGGRAGLENIWLEARTKGRSVRRDLEPNKRSKQLSSQSFIHKLFRRLKGSGLILGPSWS